MSFADIEVNRGQFNKNIKRTEFMALPEGAHLVRILQSQAKTKPTHFFNQSKTTVLCLGDECPICANNRKLIMQFPDNFRDQAGYNKVNWRFFVNVLDKTPAKVCAKCGKEYKDTRQTICTCGEILPAEIKPLNKVKVLSKGTTLRDDIDKIDKAIQDNTGTPIGLMNYDIMLMVSGSGRDTKITPVPRTDINDAIPEGLELFDIEKATIVLDPSEMLDIQRGVSLKDIFAARKSKEEVSFDPIVDQVELEKVNKAVDELFNQA